MISPEFDNMRRFMIDSQLRTSGVNTAWILSIMGTVPRDKFVPVDRAATAYSDRSVPLGSGRSLNPPLTTGLMLQAAGLQSDDTVLLVGAATGYLARLIAAHVASVTAVEQSTDLLVRARKNLNGLSNVALIEGPLNSGAQDNAPYSVVIIDGAITTLPDAIIAQLANGGRLVCGLLEGPVSRLALGYKRQGAVSLRTVTECEIAPFPGFAREKEFVF
jgi:protein-L-isoaspartate(D-aspartate) O-methyltransferase